MELIADMIGMKCFKGSLNGSPIDSGAIYTIVRMDDRYNKQDANALNWKFGHFVEEWKTPNSEYIMRMSALKPSIKKPVPVRITLERVSNGRDTTDILVDVVPLAGEMVDQNTGEITGVAPARPAAPAGAAPAAVPAAPARKTA